MLSRSSSAYQPLEQVASHEAAATSIHSPSDASRPPRKSTSCQYVDAMSHEMTSIAIISQHPLRAASGVTSARIATVPVPTLAGADPHIDLDLSLCSLDLPAGHKEGSWAWTNFHFVMCIGVMGFLVFWFFLLCRMYLPREFQFFGKSKP